MQSGMTIKHENIGARGRFYAEGVEAQLEYVMPNNHIMQIDHTEVGEGLEGQGVGKQLVVAAVDFARKANLKIKPVCPFAKAILERGKDYEDILLKS